MHLTYEICVDSTDGAMAAELAGASRAELSAGLFEGGITPSLGLVETTLAALSSLRVHVLVRPRGGDFIYDEHEIRAMERDIAAVRAAGAHGVVIGALTPDGDVDRATMDRLAAQAGTMQITFHRAFDMVADPRGVLETLIDRGYHRVLTSGQESSALEGAPLIAELVRQAGDRIAVMAGGGITARNARRVAEATGVREMHFAALVPMPSPAVYRNARAFMGDALRQSEFVRPLTSRDVIEATMAAAATHGDVTAAAGAESH
jgi:copper homeostasis protein